MNTRRLAVLAIVVGVGCDGAPSGGIDAAVRVDSSVPIDAPGSDAPLEDGAIEADAATPSSCEEPTILDGFVATRAIYVSPSGNDANDGLAPDRAWRSLANAGTLMPGDEVRIAAGTYPCGVYVEGLRGTAERPIVFRSVDGRHAARFECAGGGGLAFVSVAYLAFDGIEIAGTTSGHGFHVHSGGLPVSFRSHHVLVIRSSIHDSMLSSIKVSQSTHLDIVDCDLFWTAPTGAVGGQGIDFVAVDSSRILRNRIHDVRGNVSIQIKGGSTDVLVDGNEIWDTDIGVNLGQSTGAEYFLPRDATWEGLRVSAINNVVYGHTRVGMNAQGCVDCLIANNTLALIDSGQPLRALTGDVGLEAPAGSEAHTTGLRLIGNLVHLSGTGPGALLNFTPDNVGGLVQSNNLFFDTDAAIASLYSDHPVAGTGTIVDVDPLLTAPATGDVTLGAGSPAIGASIPVPEVRTDATGACRTTWNIGAR